MAPKKAQVAEAVNSQSAAEFFSEHQQIAGFDNPGKSLFTTIREFVENSLDAAESMHVLPDIELFIEEYSEDQHNILNGIHTNAKKKKSASSGVVDGNDEGAMDLSQMTVDETTTKSTKASKKPGDKNTKGEKTDKEQMYYVIRCKDNGCGIPERNIADMLGRVLSGSKHGIRQTRGKFGLGAKMALIWSKKSSGLPISIRTAHATSAEDAPSRIVSLSLDIDIYKNEPKIISKSYDSNEDQWRGAEIAVTIAGSWSNYRSRVLQYFQQLAVITPYANLSVDFKCIRDEKKSFRADFGRRSDQMPSIAQEIDPHPKSLNNITLSNLLNCTRCQTIEKFLTTDLSGITPSIAGKITQALEFSTGVKPASLTSAQVAAMVQTLRDEKQIKHPVAVCLSPAGEYNIRLGVLKELKPKMVATFSDKSGAHEGHPFIVEAAVSWGGSQVREGINVYRFANRIPLLFEPGADVVTQVATKRINWNSYHIDAKKDNVGVYVSIVSTKIPFKGTSKEYVGDDVLEIRASVKRALQGCCQQLRVQLAKSMAHKEGMERKKTLVKYIPDISRSLFAVLNKMRAKIDGGSSSSGSKRKAAGGADSPSSTRLRMVEQVNSGSLSSDKISESLNKGVDKFEEDSQLNAAFASAATSVGAGGQVDRTRPDQHVRVQLFLRPTACLQHNPFSPSSSSSSSSTNETDYREEKDWSNEQHVSGSQWLLMSPTNPNPDPNSNSNSNSNSSSNSKLILPSTNKLAVDPTAVSVPATASTAAPMYIQVVLASS